MFMLTEILKTIGKIRLNGCVEEKTGFAYSNSAMDNANLVLETCKLYQIDPYDWCYESDALVFIFSNAEKFFEILCYNSGTVVVAPCEGDKPDKELTAVEMVELIRSMV